MKTAVIIAMTLSLATGAFYARAGEQPPPIPSQEQPQVLTSGPVHEAFAEPVILQNQAGLTVPNQPPPDIEEIPPAERPRGSQYVWVPGYWSWDEDQSRYTWVSGCWRAAPPNMSWVPGYWSRVSSGWEWVPGCWVAAGIRNIEYLPAPPEYDYQPPGPPPSPDDIWVPPCPYWYQDSYVLRPGYWMAERPDWVWVPSHYIWTPRGYIFCNGYWDYPFEDRGVLFAPVYFPPEVYVRVGFVYSPTIIVDLDIVAVYLFTYPRYCHYFFGDYYSGAYIQIGIFPEFYVDQYYTWYDPIYVHDRWQHRHDPGWEENRRDDYRLRQEHRDLRPPRTYQEMETRQASLPEKERRSFRLAEPLTAYAASRETPVKFERMNSKTQQNTARQGTAVRTFGSKRNRWESAPEGQKPAQPPTEEKGRVTPPSEQKGTQQPPAEHREQVTQPGGSRPPFVPPHEVHKTQPERVSVPAPPIVGRRPAAQKTPPPRPDSERKSQGGEKETGKKRGR